MKQKDKKVWTPYVMVFPVIAVMMLVVVLPIINTILQSFQTVDGTFTMANYQYFFTSKEAFQSLIFTAIEAFSTLLLAIIFSFLLALYLRFSKSKISRFIGRLYLLPRFIPGIVAVYAVMNIIKDAGFINRFLQLFGIAYKPGLLYDMKGIILCNLWFNIPFSALLLSAALSAVEDSYVESARVTGCSYWKIFQKIIWPLVYKDVIVAATFILMGQIGAFTIPYLTGPNNPKMLGILLYQQVNTYLDYQKAAALSVLMFLLCLGGAVVYIKSNMKEEVWEKGR